MAILGDEVSRHRYRAVIPLDEDADLALREDFFSRCSTLAYRDMAALSQGLQVTLRTVRNWKYGVAFPTSFGRAIAIMRWIDNGKPMIHTKAMRQNAGVF